MNCGQSMGSQESFATERLSLSHTPLPPQGFLLLPKTECDVREVEFARCLRPPRGLLEPVAFRLPRVRVSWGCSMPTPSPATPGPCQGLWGLAGLVARLPHPLLCGASAPYSADILSPVETSDWGPGSRHARLPSGGLVCPGPLLGACDSPFLHRCRKSSSGLTCSPTPP